MQGMLTLIFFCQVSLLFQSIPLNNDKISTNLGVYYAQMETLDGLLSWLAILWERGLFHENPQGSYLFLYSLCLILLICYLLVIFIVLILKLYLNGCFTVRCLIMESFLGIDWDRYENLAQKVSRSFILGPLVRGLNDAVHHKDFGKYRGLNNCYLHLLKSVSR